MSWLKNMFGQKYYLAPQGYDPTVDPLPAGWDNRKAASGGAGLGDWLLILVLGALMALIVWFGISRMQKPAAASAPTAAPTGLASETASGPLLEGAGGISANATRTPLVWPTIGVQHHTATPGPSPTATETAAGVSTGGSPTASPTFVLGPTSTASPAPTQTARVVYVDNGGGGGPGPTQLVYVTVPAEPTDPPLPTYTPYPTYTPLPVTATATASPTVLPTCAPPPTPDPTLEQSNAKGQPVYLPLVFGPGETALSCP